MDKHHSSEPRYTASHLPMTADLSAEEAPLMSEALRTLQAPGSMDQKEPRLLGVFARWRLLAYGYTFPVFYGAFFLYLYWRGLWLANENGAPVYHDFTCFWVAGWQALHGETA